MNRVQAKILDALCNDSPAWTVTSLAGWTFAGDEKLLERELKALGRAIERPELAVRRIPYGGTVHRHEPGCCFGDTPAALAAFAADRMAKAGREKVRLVRPAAEVLKVFGARAKPKNPFSVGHDLVLSDSAVANRLLGTWVYEAEPPGKRRMHEAQPDAAIVRSNGLPLKFVEALGGASYTAGRIAKLMEYADGSNVPIEFV